MVRETSFRTRQDPGAGVQEAAGVEAVVATRAGAEAVTPPPPVRVREAGEEGAAPRLAGGPLRLAGGPLRLAGAAALRGSLTGVPALRGRLAGVLALWGRLAGAAALRGSLEGVPALRGRLAAATAQPPA